MPVADVVAGVDATRSNGSGGTSGTGRARIGLLTVRFTLFDREMPPEFPGRMRAHAARSAEILREHFDVIETGVVEDDEGAAQAHDLLERERLDAIVFAPTMAAPPSFAVRALAGSNVPVVIWNAPSIRELGPGLTQSRATEHSTTVGSIMYGNVTVREGRPAPTVTAAHGDAAATETLIRTVRAVAAAGSIRGRTVLRVGDPIPGYLDVDADAVDLGRLGLRERAVSLDEWESAVEAVRDDEAAAFVAGLPARGYPGDPGPGAIGSAKVAIALERALDTHDAIGGTVNCHGPWFRRSERVGVVACLGVACQSEAGRPLACTGDQPTGILQVLARRIAGAALYSESYAPEIATGLMLFAGGPEGDPAWAAPRDALRLVENRHYPGARGNGIGLTFPLRLGPATLLSLSPVRSGWVLVWATGEVTESRYEEMRGPNGMFRFDNGPIAEATSRWIASGATHHNALAPGRLDVEIPALAAALGIGHRRI